MKGLRLRVGNGRNINFFKDKWLPRDFSFKVLSLGPFGVDLPIFEFFTTAKQWDIPKLRQFVTNEDLMTITKIPL